MRKSTLIILLIVGIAITGCGKRGQDVGIKGYDLSFPLPDSWTVTQNDTTDKGALCVLIKRDSGESHDPTICIWVGNYAQELAGMFGIKPGIFMVLMAVSGADDVQETLRTGRFEMSLDINLNQKTEHTFVDFKISGSDVATAVTAIDRENKNKSGTFFTISVAASKESIDETKGIADQLVTHILAQLNASPEKHKK